MNVWFTSDLHVGHQLPAGERMRGRVLPRYVGAEVDAHDRMLAANWDRCVKPEDVVWVLGDISAGGDLAQAYALNWIHDRPGVKHLVAGNHDGCWPGLRDSHRWQSAYLQVFASAQAFARRRIDGRSVLLSHFPYAGDHVDGGDRYSQYRLRDEGISLLHGHTHSSERVSFAARLDWESDPLVHKMSTQIHVGVDAWDLSPVPLDTVAQMLL